jgi:predicted signal transduction protein with EAL and GGDEF domain
VETAEQLEWLRAIGCEYAQGFYFSRAVDVSAATELIASSPWRNDALFMSGHAVQLHMWPADALPVRVS